ncbi:MAG: PfaD family polyunsaturated fatty acid/polyketide biosynthesis protein [Deltaproteobacteria bacterium]|nr:MAG: PfaD family polyunsaturated fatty acid/polyketide biosynthesis protein [Deltaproteobacteria bacterium]
MSLEQHLRALEDYGAAECTVAGASQTEVASTTGGDLAGRFEALGQRPLLTVLADPRVERVELKDGTLCIAAERKSGGGRLTVSWGDDVVVDEDVALPAVEAPHQGPVFRPDPDSRVDDLRAALHEARRPLFAVREGEAVAWYSHGLHGAGMGARPLVGTVPPVGAETLGSVEFRRAHGVRWAYVAGAMAGGIASADLVIAMARAGLLGFFGSGGLPVPAVREALERVSREAGAGAWGFNLLHNPVEPAVEESTVDLYLEYGVRRVSASAYMGLTPAVVRYRLHGIHADASGEVVCPNHVFAKVSRAEVAQHFLKPAPEAMVAELVAGGQLTAEQAELAKRVPMASDVTAEADSGGHTDRRPLFVLLPLLQQLRDQLAEEHGFTGRHRPRIGAAGGLGTPAAVHGAFAMGAEYVLTGSVNQASREAGTSDMAKEMLAAAGMADVATGPAPDMFEIGAHVQVLSRGSMYAQRAGKLYDLYKSVGDLDKLDAKERAKLEKQVFQRPLADVWEGTREYWQGRDPKQVEKAEADPRHKMALTFRWYLGMTSRWARMGDSDRKRDFQIWCGPSMGGFNAWVAGSELEAIEERGVVEIAEALMQGAAAHARLAFARTQGLRLPAGALSAGPS